MQSSGKKHTYAPELNKRSVLIDKDRQQHLFDGEDNQNTEPINRYELLFEYHKYLLEKRQKKKEVAIEEDLKECTFKPHLVSVQMESKNSNINRINSSLGSSLYGYDEHPGVSLYERERVKRQLKEHKLNDRPKNSQELKEEKELSECTFQPDLSASQYNKDIHNRNTSKDVRGFEKFNARLKYAQEKKLADQELVDN